MMTAKSSDLCVFCFYFPRISFLHFLLLIFPPCILVSNTKFIQVTKMKLPHSTFSPCHDRCSLRILHIAKILMPIDGERQSTKIYKPSSTEDTRRRKIEEVKNTQEKINKSSQISKSKWGGDTIYHREIMAIMNSVH